MGIENLISTMIEKGEAGLGSTDCTVGIDRSLEIDGRKCSLITITFEKQREGLDFHQAHIYFDDERNIPVGYEGYWWPDEPGGEPKLMESYFYKDLKLNVGLTDADFDPQNPDYNYR